MKKHILFTLFLTSFIFEIKSQTLQDSVSVVYKNYFDLLKTKEKVDSLNNTITELIETTQINSTEIKKIIGQDLFSLERQVKIKRTKIINTSAFVFSANSSLNAIKTFGAVTDYLNQVSELNSPINEDLGFSLSKEIETLLKDKIIKGSNKVNGGEASKFLNIVETIIKNPITEAITSAVPVIGSLKSVVDLVLGAAIRGKDVTVDDIVSFKTGLKNYLEHYEGLAKTQLDFSQKLNSIDVRKEALILILQQFAIERLITLKPEITKTQLANLSLTTIVTNGYSRENVQREVDLIIFSDSNNFQKLLEDNRLGYPDYGLSQAKFIKDEIESLSKEYIAAYESYQLSIKSVLEKSKNIGNPSLIDNKVRTLEEKLTEVNSSFRDNINMENLNKKFMDLAGHYE